MNCLWGGLVSACALDITEQSGRERERESERRSIQSPEASATDLVAR
jgi:hypothetical protein